MPCQPHRHGTRPEAFETEQEVLGIRGLNAAGNTNRSGSVNGGLLRRMTYISPHQNDKRTSNARSVSHTRATAVTAEDPAVRTMRR